jgi:hypothetical protein
MEDCFSVVLDLRRFAMHQTLGSNDFAPKRHRQRLMAEADT